MTKILTEEEFYNMLDSKAQETEPFFLLDSLAFKRPLTRACAANIVHNYIRRVLKEEASADWTAASKLSDLYDCHTCVSHIAECYIKGIMDGRTVEKDGRMHYVFEGKALVSMEEAEIILGRVLNPKLRIPQENGSSQEQKEAIEISRENLEKWLFVNKSVNLVDVRCKKEFESSEYTGGINIEFKEFMNNPYLLADNPEDLLKEYCFVCNDGYQSRMAASLALGAGFKKVYYAGLKI